MAVPASVLAVGRAGAGTNNIPVAEFSKRGIPVFNAPGANANAVKELVLAGLFLGARNICQAWAFAQSLSGDDRRHRRGGREGQEEFRRLRAARPHARRRRPRRHRRRSRQRRAGLGMKVLGYDPQITVQRAWQLSSNVEQALSLDDLFARSDAISVHVPLNADTRGLVNAARLKLMKKGGVILNFARAAIVDEKAVVAALDDGHLQAYVCDFPNNALKDHPKVVTLPHLGASTGEAEENCAVMVAETLRDFLENGNIRNSVNFPEAVLPRVPDASASGHRQLQRAQHGRPDLHVPRRGRAQHRRPAQQVPRRVRLHAHRHRRRGGRRCARKIRASTACSPRGCLTRRVMARLEAREAHATPASRRSERQPPRRADLAEVRARIDAVDASIHALHQRARRPRAAGRHLQDTATAAPSISTAPSARRRCCAWRRRATRARCATRKSCGCSARSCPRASRSRSRSRWRTSAPKARSRRRPCSSISATRCARCRWPRSTRCSTRSKPASPISAWCPIENSTEGTVNNTLDRFFTSPLKICGEVELRIHQFLMGKMPRSEDIKRICSHPQSLAQCRGWLDEHLPDVERVPVSSNAEGARRARDEQGTAAIAGDTAAEVYGLKVLAAEIEDRPDNTTRFFVLGRKLFTPSGEDRTTLLSRSRTRMSRARCSGCSSRSRSTSQHDAHRVAALAAEQVGLRVLHRHRRARGRDRTSPRRWRRSRSAPRCSGVLGSYPRAVSVIGRRA